MTNHHTCVRCHRLVVREADRYDIFEKMHWSCFHFEFEHGVAGETDDPDIACPDPACPARAHDPSPCPTWFEEKGSGPSAPTGRR